MKMRRSGTYENGIKYLVNANDETMHECQYCATYFIPNRRFVQKFCCESCRVMACKKRKVGMFGTTAGTLYDRNNVTNKTLVANINELSVAIKSLETDFDELKNHVSKENNKSIETMREKFNKNTDRQIAMIEKINDIKDNTKWSILINTILPFLAPWMRDKVRQVSEDENNSPSQVLDKVIEMIDPIKDQMPDEIQQKFTQVEILKQALKNNEDEKS